MVFQTRAIQERTMQFLLYPELLHHQPGVREGLRARPMTEFAPLSPGQYPDTGLLRLLLPAHYQ